LFQKQSYVGGKLSLVVDTRNNKIFPRSGVLWNNSVRFLSGLKDTKYDVTQVNSDFTFFIKVSKAFVIANRTGFGHNFGDFEFYQAQFLGSEDNLRGFRKGRFAGHTKFFNNAELRLGLARFKTYLFPGALGILGFVDAGRVWADNTTSNKLQTGYGGGLWVAPLARIILTFSYAISKEDKMPLIGLGWKF
jgi:outer membrane protein assembly factor BamA